MEKVSIAYTDSKYAVKRIIYNLEIAYDALSEARDNIAKFF